jgi:Zn-dependent peptidase ImmA (M78 family)
MKYILNGLSKYDIGLRPLTEDDFYRICEAENIEVVWSDKKFSFYLADPEFDIYCITLPKRRKGLRLLYEMFHELGHHFMHVGSEPAAAFSGLTNTKDELEADAIALVALIPRSKLKEMAFLDGSRLGDHLYNERLRLYFLYGI